MYAESIGQMTCVKVRLLTNAELSEYMCASEMRLCT